MKRIIGAMAMVGMVLLLSGCGVMDTMKDFVPSLKAKTPAQHMMALEVEYNGVFALMKEYEGLTRCHVTASDVCSKQDVVDKMRAINTAFDAQSAAAWKIIRDTSNSASVKDTAIKTVVGIVGQARTLYSSVNGVIAAFKEKS